MQNVCSSKTVKMSRVTLGRNVCKKKNVPIRGLYWKHRKTFHSAVIEALTTQWRKVEATPKSYWLIPHSTCGGVLTSTYMQWPSRDENTGPMQSLGWGHSQWPWVFCLVGFCLAFSSGICGASVRWQQWQESAGTDFLSDQSAPAFTGFRATHVWHT